jgi:hypothetical protein
VLGFTPTLGQSGVATGTPTSKMDWDVWVHSCTISYTHESMKCDFKASFLAHTFASLCLGYEPKAKVVIANIYLLDHPMKQTIINIYFDIIWWPLNESFTLIFSFPNGQLLISNFPKVWN